MGRHRCRTPLRVCSSVNRHLSLEGEGVVFPGLGAAPLAGNGVCGWFGCKGWGGRRLDTAARYQLEGDIVAEIRQVDRDGAAPARERRRRGDIRAGLVL